ncbi:hypothetical protein SDC9_57853 [bioreactor metagenome]|uniref:Uncharacterized protein n=1 Tax=bioreactor metagenome TaxID=1076179 RepID=A0A644X6C9_9ZZZZ
MGAVPLEYESLGGFYTVILRDGGEIGHSRIGIVCDEQHTSAALQIGQDLVLFALGNIRGRPDDREAFAILRNGFLSEQI